MQAWMAGITASNQDGVQSVYAYIYVDVLTEFDKRIIATAVYESKDNFILL